MKLKLRASVEKLKPWASIRKIETIGQVCNWGKIRVQIYSYPKFVSGGGLGLIINHINNYQLKIKCNLKPTKNKNITTIH